MDQKNKGNGEGKGVNKKWITPRNVNLAATDDFRVGIQAILSEIYATSFLAQFNLGENSK